MRIQIGDRKEGTELSMSNEPFNTPDWVEIGIGEAKAEVSVAELLSAAQAFMIYKREEEHKEDF